MSRRLLAVGVVIAAAALAYFLTAKPDEGSARPMAGAGVARVGGDSDEPGPVWDEAADPVQTVEPTQDDIAIVQRLMQGDADAGVAPTTGIGLAAALQAGIPRERVREALDIAAQRVIAETLAGCARTANVSAPVAVTVRGGGEFIETMESTGPGEFADCTRALFGVYLPHEASRREFTIPVP